MALPPLYKYLSVEGARPTLGNTTFRHAKPSTFNDTDDLTVAGMFPESVEEALSNIVANLGNVILANLQRPVTCPKASMRNTVEKLQTIFRANPEASAIFSKKLQDNPALLKLDVENIKAMAEQTIIGVNDLMQGYRVLCVSTLKDSERMWSGYAEHHKGIALRIEANTEKGSKFELFRPVTYREKRPTIYRNAVQFPTSSLFDDQDASKLAMMDDIIYTKTLKWQYESEYRLAIPRDQGEPDWEALKFHPEEITELYLGLAIVNKDNVFAMANALNPKIAVFETRWSNDAKLIFDRAE